jgi:hypothetical protein
VKTFWSWLAKTLLVLVLVQAWFLYDYHNKNQQLMAENIQIETELFQAKESLISFKQKAEEQENRSLEGMLKETNKVVVSGWEKLLDAVEGELDKARDSIGQLREPKAGVQNQSDLNGGRNKSQNDDQSPEVPSGTSKAESETDLPASEPEEDIPEPIKGERT